MRRVVVTFLILVFFFMSSQRVRDLEKQVRRLEKKITTLSRMIDIRPSFLSVISEEEADMSGALALMQESYILEESAKDIIARIVARKKRLKKQPPTP